MHRRRPGPLTAAVVTAAALLASGCTGGVAESAPPAERLDDARAALDAAGSVALDLSSRDVPQRENGVTAAEGDGVVSETEPKFKGSITGTIEGVAGAVDVIAIGDTTWMRFFTPEYEEADLATLGAPNPAMFFHPGDGISSLLPATENPTAGDDVREGQEVLSTVSGTLPGAAVEKVLGLGDGTGSYDVTYGLTSNDQLRTATITGPFFPGATSTYTLVISDYGSPVAIDRP
jgi:lipoprotein LprG